MRSIFVLIILVSSIPVKLIAQELLHEANTYTIVSTSEVSAADNSYNEFKLQQMLRNGYFIFEGNIYPPAPEEDDRLPKQFITFEFLGDRYYEDPERYYPKGKKEKAISPDPSIVR